MSTQGNRLTYKQRTFAMAWYVRTEQGVEFTSSGAVVAIDKHGYKLFVEPNGDKRIKDAFLESGSLIKGNGIPGMQARPLSPYELELARLLWGYKAVSQLEV